MVREALGVVVVAAVEVELLGDGEHCPEVKRYVQLDHAQNLMVRQNGREDPSDEGEQETVREAPERDHC